MRKLMNKKLNKKGFTLMEMLIVVAIIAILVAIAIPTFNNALQKAKIAADEANLRALYAEEVTEYLLNDTEKTATTKIDIKLFGTTTKSETGTEFDVAGAHYKLQASGASATAANTTDGGLKITYSYDGGTTTIPGAVKTTTP